MAIVRDALAKAEAAVWDAHHGKGIAPEYAQAVSREVKAALRSLDAAQAEMATVDSHRRDLEAELLKLKATPSAAAEAWEDDLRAESDAVRDALRRKQELFEAALAERDALRTQLARTDALLSNLDAALDRTMTERDHAQDALQESHIALGGDGEWCAKPGSVCAAGETGDLHLDVPALAAALRARVETLEHNAEADAALIRDTIDELDEARARVAELETKLALVQKWA